MKCKNVLLGVAVYAATTLFLISCQKEQTPDVNNVEITNGVKASGVAPDNLETLSRIPMIVSAAFLSENSSLMNGTSVPTSNDARAKRDQTAPVVSITSPGNTTTVTGNITVQATASDNVGVNLVSMSVDGTLISSRTTSPYSFPWNSASVSNGTHTITVAAKDAAGNSKAVSVQVTGSNVSGGDIISPVVNITSPANGASVSGTINIQANATDNTGVNSVSYSIDGVAIGSSSSSPYTVSWNSASVAAGIHTINASASDAAGNVGSSSIQVTVNTVVIPPATLPSSYQLSMPPVRNQGTEGSCVAFAAVYAARSAEQYYKTNATSYSDGTNLFSPEFVFNQVNLGGTCTSSSVVPTLDLMKNQGVCTWQIMPYSTYDGCSILPNSTQNSNATNFKIISYSTIIAADQTAIKTMIVNKHPIIATINIDQQFYDATPGYIWSSWTNNSGYHAVTLCGYDDAKHAYKAINSWGTTWGDAGYIWIDYDFFPTVSSYYTYSISL